MTRRAHTMVLPDVEDEDGLLPGEEMEADEQDLICTLMDVEDYATHAVYVACVATGLHQSFFDPFNPETDKMQ